MNQLELHKKIEEFFKAGVDSANVDVVKKLLANEDAKRFFFSKADEDWLVWLLKNKFLKEKLEEKSEDPTRYAYRMTELEYLTRMAEKNPTKVAEIIESVKISKDTFNPEVIDRFLWIISTLPAEQIKTLTVKIRDEEWLRLMQSFKKSGYEFEKIVEKLVEAKENDALLELAQAILEIKTKEEISEKDTDFIYVEPFYIHNIYASEIFDALAEIKETHTEKALEICTKAISDIVNIAGREDGAVFEFKDSFSLYDVDFFTLEIKDKRSASSRQDVENLAAVTKKLIEKTIGTKCDNSREAKRLFDTYLGNIPESRAIWRLKLFTMSLCPEIFNEELQEAFDKVFNVGDKYFEIEGGAEYKKALRNSFPSLLYTWKRNYVAKILEYFAKMAKEDPDQYWHKRNGWEILSSVCKDLREDEHKKCEEVFGRKCDEKFEPESTIGKTQSGTVHHKSHVNLADFTIKQIIANLKYDWKPEKLNEQFKNDDFLNPRGVEGLGGALKEDIKKRTDNYLDRFTEFFNRNEIDPHYLYSLLRGVEEMLRNKQQLTLEQIKLVLELFKNIRNEGNQTPFKRKDDKSWLADWIAIHAVISDILLYVLENKELKEQIHKKCREDIKNLIEYLLSIKDSPTAEQKKPEYGDLHHIAINSVRGRAFQTLVVFVENDGKTLSNKENDVKDIYKKVLKDPSLAVRFIVGRYLSSFYFRDKKFITDLLPEIFPKDDSEKKDVYLATWEGYLTNTLYDKLFVVLQSYYKYAIGFDPKEYTERKYSKNLDESLAVHLALAFSHLGLETKDELFELFWDTANTTRHHEFISFIGRSILTRSQAGDEWLKDNKVDKEKLVTFWDWVLKNEKITDPKVFSGFGFWINPDKEIIDDEIVIDKIAKTLEKSGGDIDWDHGLMKRLLIFAEKDGIKTLSIISSYLLDSGQNLNPNRQVPMFSVEREVKGALKIIYTNGDKEIKQKVYELVNILVEKGGSMFWGLKEVLK